MGRHTGWIALYSGISAGADVIVIPEYPLTVEEIKVQNVGIHIQRKLLLR
jgi:6-phosphofructokinase 1